MERKWLCSKGMAVPSAKRFGCRMRLLALLGSPPLVPPREPEGLRVPAGTCIYNDDIIIVPMWWPA